jgi:regulator of protease activity HflC (stomatin/prohibitin superfamily)
VSILVPIATASKRFDQDDFQSNESLVCLFFGSYVGTERRPGFWWVNPFNSKKKVSRRLETLECGPLKVNDAVGNPVDIGAVVVWRVEDAAKAVLEAESYASYVKAQSETALRRMASTHPYDQVEVEEAAKQGQLPASLGKEELVSPVTLRDGGDAIADSLLQQIPKRMSPVASRSLKRASRILPTPPRSQAPCFASRPRVLWWRPGAWW